MKTFNVHYNSGPGRCYDKRRGFTAVVEQDTTQTHVNVYVSFCSLKDEFNKKKGVAQARANGVYQRVHKKALPSLLGGLYAEVIAESYTQWMGKQYDYVLRNFF